MQGRSIRSLALDYYRKRGADIRPLDGAEAYEIVQAEGQALKVTFTDEAAKEAKVLPLTATSPQWRAILEDLTADVAVSYRYLTAGPIGNPAKTLEAALPSGWRVTAAKVHHVDHRVALGVTHRATFDSPALNACQELIFQHLWDVAREERLPALEPILYTTPAILLRPEHMPGAAAMQALVDRSAGIVDGESEDHGAKLEKELGVLLAETEKRVNAYYDQQMGNVLTREVQLTEKLDATIKKLGEARTTEQMARYRAEGESLQTQLAHVQAHRERDLQAVEAACLSKLEAERERHELTATIDLVALCHATYDVLTYTATVQSPEGRAIELALRYWPITRELAFPDCPACAHPMETPVLLSGGGAVCEHCTMACGGCGSLHDARAFTAGACTGCGEATCSACEIRCATCMGVTCEAHAAECTTCEAPACPTCVKACATCETSLCEAHAHATGEVTYCAAHEPSPEAAPPAAIVEEAPVAPAVAPSTGPSLSFLITATPVETLDVPAPKVPAPKAPVAPPAPVAVEPVAVEPVAVEPVAELAPAPAAEAAPVAPSPSGLLGGASRLTGESDRMVSALSGRTLNPRVAETCHACTGRFDVQEMHDCPTCGVPACLPCTRGELGPCPACASLEDAEATDERLAFVTASFPVLAKKRKWAIAELGPYVVAHWRRHGHWGMVVYHTGEGSPAVVQEFSHGPVETLAMTVGSWFLPRRR